MAHAKNIIVGGMGGTNKGQTKRTQREELQLRVRMLNGRHGQDVLQKAQDELGDRADLVGPIDMSTNLLKSMVDRKARAYTRPPLVSDLPTELALLIGDHNARTTIGKYGAAGGRPMPTQMIRVSRETQRFAVACNWAATLIGYSVRDRRPWMQTITPDDVWPEYNSDSPWSPTVIRHYRRRVDSNGRTVEHTDIYDLTDLDAPKYTIVTSGGDDVTKEVLGDEWWALLQSDDGWFPWWRYAPTAEGEKGKPFHRIVIEGEPREPFRGMEVSEATLTSCVRWTHWGAGIRDAGWPQRSALGLEFQDADSDSSAGEVGSGGATGTLAGPEYVWQWLPTHEDRPGTLHQFGPGFNPEVIGKAIRERDLSVIESTGLPVSYEQTGGEPTATEARALEEAIQETYPEARGHDSLVLWRTSAMVNRATEWLAANGEDDVTVTAFPERPYGVLYREEVAEALLEAVEKLKVKSATVTAGGETPPEVEVEAESEEDEDE